MRGGFRHFFSSKSVFVKHPRAHCYSILVFWAWIETLSSSLVENLVIGHNSRNLVELVPSPLSPVVILSYIPLSPVIINPFLCVPRSYPFICTLFLYSNPLICPFSPITTKLRTCYLSYILRILVFPFLFSGVSIISKN